MLILLLGPDDFSKQQYAQELATKEKAGLEVFSLPEQLPIDRIISQDLFAAKKMFLVLEGFKLVNEKNLQQLVSGSNQIFFAESKVDKRIKFNKDLLADKAITVKDFVLPHGKELDTWIVKRVKELGGKILASAAGELAVRLGRDSAKETKFGGKVVEVQEVYNLWQADSEIKKLLSYAKDGEITQDHVQSLVGENMEVDVFGLTNAIADKEKQKALELLHQFLKQQTGSDEKTAIIQLNALLAEQFRNVAIVQNFLDSRTLESEILEKTGWKSGRLFVIKKIAGKFSSKKILDFLGKLEALDEELKTGSTPPRVLLDLIVSQLLA